jgi:hypothetical protein
MKMVKPKLRPPTVLFLFFSLILLGAIAFRISDWRLGLISGDTETIKRQEQDKIVLYTVPKEYFLPHFYIPQSIIYSVGGKESLSDIIGFNDYPTRTAVYFEDLPFKNEKILEMADGVFVKPRLMNGISNNSGALSLPYVSQKPGSLLYYFVILEEKYEKWRLKRKVEGLMEKQLFFALKRIAELKKWGAEKAVAGLSLQGYQEEMNKVFEEVQTLNGESRKRALARLRVYWDFHQQEIEAICAEKRLSRLERLFDELVLEVDEKMSLFEEKINSKRFDYSFTIPKEGRYELFVKKGTLSVEEITETKKMLDGKDFPSKEPKQEKDNWLELGGMILDKGEHQLVLTLPESENLVSLEGNLPKGQEDFGKEITTELFSQTFFPQAKNMSFWPIKNWGKSSLYLVSFDYKIEEGALGISILEEVERPKEGVAETKEGLQKVLRVKKKEWSYFETLVASDDNSSGAKIYFFSLVDSGQLAKASFRNLKITKVNQPDLMLRAVDLSPSQQIIPKISFQEVNPTKYKIAITGAVTPYLLVFSENFHQDWRAGIISAGEERKIEGETVADYFQGEILEKKPKNSFWEENFFKKQDESFVPQTRHLEVNSYANSWLIFPEESNGRSEYQIMVEFWPQKLSQLGIIITGLSTVVTLIYLVFIQLHERREK